ncbi:MAG: hypothetical protein WAK20_11645 [Candidatus Acidiferrum sp.]
MCGSVFVLGGGYLMAMILVVLKLSDTTLWVGLSLWAVLVVWYGWWWSRKD